MLHHGTTKQISGVNAAMQQNHFVGAETKDNKRDTG